MTEAGVNIEGAGLPVDIYICGMAATSAGRQDTEFEVDICSGASFANVLATIPFTQESGNTNNGQYSQDMPMMFPFLLFIPANTQFGWRVRIGDTQSTSVYVRLAYIEAADLLGL